MSAPSIAVISPASGAVGTATNTTIDVTFDSEVDHSTVQIILEGADTDRVTGPDFARWDDPTTTADDDILATPGYKGIVAGALSFVAVDASGVEVSGIHDYTGSGTAWRTKAVFTPTLPLAPNVQYKVYVVGDDDEVDEYKSGVSSRTVFDTQKGANLGTGYATFSGGYDGAIDDKFWVEILTTGESGAVRFKWWKDSAPLIVRELKTTLGSQLLADGAYVKFTGSLEAGDQFSAVVKPPVRMATTYYWVFTTGDGALITIPDSVSSPASGFGAVSEAAATADLQILSITPAERTTNLNPDDVGIITIKFNKALDETTITDDTVTIWSESVNGDPTYTAEGVLAKVLSVSGDTLTIQIS